MLESGFTRRKNSINVAIKNLADFCLSTMVFWAVGFGLMFGATWSGWFGADTFVPDFTDRQPHDGSESTVALDNRKPSPSIDDDIPF